jgi:hypothetical protein
MRRTRLFPAFVIPPRFTVSPVDLTKMGKLAIPAAFRDGNRIA